MCSIITCFKVIRNEALCLSSRGDVASKCGSVFRRSPKKTKCVLELRSPTGGKGDLPWREGARSWSPQGNTLRCAAEPVGGGSGDRMLTGGFIHPFNESSSRPDPGSGPSYPGKGRLVGQSLTVGPDMNLGSRQVSKISVVELGTGNVRSSWVVTAEASVRRSWAVGGEKKWGLQRYFRGKANWTWWQTGYEEWERMQCQGWLWFLLEEMNISGDHQWTQSSMGVEKTIYICGAFEIPTGRYLVVLTWGSRTWEYKCARTVTKIASRWDHLGMVRADWEGRRPQTKPLGDRTRKG